MDYSIKAHPTNYRGTVFRSRLEARWAAFFDLAGWKWEYEPLDLHGWTPDFFVEFPCGHSQCSGSHSLLVEIKPYHSLDQFKDHKCIDWPYGANRFDGSFLPMGADASAAFGINPSVTYWEMAHGDGGGTEDISGWLRGKSCIDLWSEAGNLTRYKPNRIIQLDSASTLNLMLEINRLRAERSNHD